MSEDVHAVWWRTALSDGPIHWVGAWSNPEDARAAQLAVAGNWIDTGIITLRLNGPLPEKP